jgi:hypothetical protein
LGMLLRAVIGGLATAFVQILDVKNYKQSKA